MSFANYVWNLKSGLHITSSVFITRGVALWTVLGLRCSAHTPLWQPGVWFVVVGGICWHTSGCFLPLTRMSRLLNDGDVMWKYTFLHRRLMWIHVAPLKKAPTAQASRSLTKRAYYHHKQGCDAGLIGIGRLGAWVSSQDSHTCVVCPNDNMLHTSYIFITSRSQAAHEIMQVCFWVYRVCRRGPSRQVHM
jgi:hypothetical protein